MLPSRGLRPAVLDAQKSFLLQSPLKSAIRPKKFSTAPAFNSNARTSPSSAPTLLSSSRWKTTELRSRIAIPSIAAVRFNSTSPAAQTPTLPPTSTGGDASALPSFRDLTQELPATDISSMPERIGYLHDLGLDYGYGPTSVLEWTLEHVHVYSGMPWWFSVATTAVIVRVLCLPLYMRMTDTVAKQAALMPVLKPLQAKQKLAVQSKDQALLQSTLSEMQEVYRDSGIKMKNMFIGPLIQGVLGYCTFKLTRAMASLPVPGLQTGGFAWLSDLTIPDPYYILPLTTAALMHVVGRRGGESGVQQLSDGQRKIFLYVLPAVAAGVTSFLPGITQLSFFVASSISIMQSMAFRNPAVRRALKLTPMYTQPAAAPKVLDTTATIKRGPTTRLNMSPSYQSPRRGNSTAAGTVASEEEYSSTLQKVANAPFKPLVNAVKSGKEWVNSQVIQQTGKDLNGKGDSGKRKGTLAGRRK